jgi:hypothetical protein
LAGAWTIHVVIIACLKILYDVIPGSSQEASWTLTNMTYMVGSYIMFHYVRGIPFDFNGGAFDNLNMWEQIDNGAQYTPTKKFLLSVPIVLFLISTHYTHYDSTYFVINFLATLAVVIPKLPFVSNVQGPLFGTWGTESRDHGNQQLTLVLTESPNAIQLLFRHSRRRVIGSFGLHTAFWGSHKYELRQQGVQHKYERRKRKEKKARVGRLGVAGQWVSYTK